MRPLWDYPPGVRAPGEGVAPGAPGSITTADAINAYLQAEAVFANPMGIRDAVSTAPDAANLGTVVASDRTGTEKPTPQRGVASRYPGSYTDTEGMEGEGSQRGEQSELQRDLEHLRNLEQGPVPSLVDPETGRNVSHGVMLGGGNPTGPRPAWPSNDGFLGTPHLQTLQPGTLVDRYGKDDGSYLAPYGTPFEQRSLPPDYVNSPYRVYRVVKPINVMSGITAPAPQFGQPGLGIQYKSEKSVEYLRDNGYLAPIEP